MGNCSYTQTKKMKEHSGVDTYFWDEWMSYFGKYKDLVSSVLIAVAIFAALLTLCGCCCIPCIRALLLRLIASAVGPLPPQGQYVELQQEDRPPDDVAVALV